MKSANSKISLGFGLAILFVVASCVYSLGYKMAMNKFNNMVSYTKETQKMYSDLSEIDYTMRNEYIEDVDESKLLRGICSGYFSELKDDNCKFLNRYEYSEYLTDIDNYPAEIVWDELDNSIGYLNCGTFGKNSSDMFLERLKYFESMGIKKIILDLRLSEKGNMTEVLEILREILPSDNLVYSVNKNGNKETVCSPTGTAYEMEFIVLTSNMTSGPSEVLVSNLRDSFGTKVIGETTAGNTIREKTVEISENSVIIFPNARYVTSKGEDPYKKGVIPDEIIELPEDKILALKESSLSYEDDCQLQRAISMFST